MTKDVLKSRNSGQSVKVGDHLFVGLHSANDLIEYEVLVIDVSKKRIWAAVVMSPRNKPIGLRDWIKATDLDCT